MPGVSRHGFTLIEVLVAVALMALLATIIIPNLGRRAPRIEREQFVGKLNALMQFAWQSALTTNKLQRIDVSFTRRMVTVWSAEGKDDKGKPAFKRVKRSYMDTQVAWPKNLEVKNFYIDGKDAMEDFVGRAIAEVFFYIVPDGMAQEIIINGFDTKDRLPNGRQRPFSLVLNPFSAQFRYYDSFQK